MAPATLLRLDFNFIRNSSPTGGLLALPIFKASAEEAFENRRQNEFATWPQRGQNNRIEPMARLGSSAPFTFEPGASIFTVGSCFARNVEKFLLSAKFRVPMLEFTKSSAFAGIPIEGINNYSVPSIHNEFRWALEDDGLFNPDVHCFETLNGFVDLHLGAHQKALPLEVVKARREAVSRAYRTVTDCDAIIMTLGLSEVWFDTQSGVYINHTPLPNITKIEPERFELHVLSYEEVRTHIISTIEIIAKHSKKKPKIIISVSPVPLMTTFRTSDVAVSNCYSKSVLRSVADELVSCYDYVSYFPSFESVTLSDRKIAWLPDQIHVTQDIVALQVARMLRVYAPHVEIDMLEDLQESAVIEQAASSMSGLKARLFFQQYADEYITNPAFLVPYIRFLFTENEHLKASHLCELLKGTSIEEAVLKAKALRLTGRAGEALMILEPSLSNEQRAGDVWEEVVLDYAALDDVTNALRVGEAWFKTMPYDLTARPRVARAISRLDRQRAEALNNEALAANPDNYFAKVLSSELQAL